MRGEKMRRSSGIASSSAAPTRSAFILASMALVATAPVTRADDWPAYQHDTAHTGYTAASPDPRKLTLKWSAPTGYSTPLIVGSNVIATRNGGGTGLPTTISSFNIDTGAVNWSYTGSYTFASQAAYANGLVTFSAGENGADANKLIVLDAATGALKYKVALGISDDTMPMMVREANGTTTAYFADVSKVKAVSLGATSGTVLWTASGNYGGSSLPTLVGGNTIVLAGPGQYYAIDRATGAQNHFQNGNILGGGGDAVVYDAARSAFYVLDAYDGLDNALTAYHFGGSYNAITRLWQKTGTGVADAGQVALDASGNLYSVDPSNLVEFDPATGNILRSRTGQSFAPTVAPLIAGNILWAYDYDNDYAYDLTTLERVATFPSTRLGMNFVFDSPGAVDDFHYVLDHERIVNSPGFDVYAAPEPGALGTLFIPALALAARRRRRSRP
jgi:hypothetical protein